MRSRASLVWFDRQYTDFSSYDPGIELHVEIVAVDGSHFGSSTIVSDVIILRASTRNLLKTRDVECALTCRPECRSGKRELGAAVRTPVGVDPSVELL